MQPDGSVVIGVTTAWPWGGSTFIHPASSVVFTFPNLSLNNGSYNVTYYGNHAESTNNFMGSTSILSCAAASLADQASAPAENQK